MVIPLKVKFTLEKAMKALRSSALSLTLALDGPLYPGEKTRYSYRKLGGPPGPVWTGVENLAPTGIRSSDLPACSKSLYRLCYPTVGDNFYLRLFNYTAKVRLYSNE